MESGSIIQEINVEKKEVKARGQNKKRSNSWLNFPVNYFTYKIATC